ncbi:hypothetical protein D3C80_1663380 [compost metagenome]
MLLRLLILPGSSLRIDFIMLGVGLARIPPVLAGHPLLQVLIAFRLIQAGVCPGQILVGGRHFITPLSRHIQARPVIVVNRLGRYNVIQMGFPVFS